MASNEGPQQRVAAKRAIKQAYVRASAEDPFDHPIHELFRLVVVGAASPQRDPQNRPARSPDLLDLEEGRPPTNEEEAAIDPLLEAIDSLREATEPVESPRERVGTKRRNFILDPRIYGFRHESDSSSVMRNFRASETV